MQKLAVSSSTLPTALAEKSRFKQAGDFQACTLHFNITKPGMLDSRTSVGLEVIQNGAETTIEYLVIKLMKQSRDLRKECIRFLIEVLLTSREENKKLPRQWHEGLDTNLHLLFELHQYLSPPRTLRLDLLILLHVVDP